MTNNTGKEQWIEEVLRGADNIARPQPRLNVYDGVMQRLAHPSDTTYTFPVKRWVVAAVLLLALNVTSVLHYRENSTAAEHQENPLAMQIQSSSTYNY